MADEPNLVPTGAPSSPPFADACVVHNSGTVMTIFHLRVPIAFSEEERQARDAQRSDKGEIHAPVVSSVTMTIETAVMVADMIYNLAGKDPAER